MKIDMSLVKNTVIFAICISLVDTVWVNFYMKQKYVNYLRSIGYKMSVNVMSAVIAYIIMIVAYPLLIYSKNNREGLMKALSVGLVIFGTYGFTLAAIFPKYDMKFALTETLWGAVLYSVSFLLTSFISGIIG